MFKQVEKTPTIRDWIASAYGDKDVDTDGLAVFEAVAANTRPLRRLHGLHAGAMLQPDVLHGMTKALKQGETIPLHSMHQTDNTPVGRVFAAETRPDIDGGMALHTMFYMDPKHDPVLVDKLNKGILNEVSVGVSVKEVRCSACGWDYMGTDSTIDNLVDGECPDGHVIGKDGVHVKLHGLASWHELSLVDRGAAKGALILPKSRHSMTRSPDFERLAASGFEPSLLSLRAICDVSAPTPTPSTPKAPGKSSMDELVNLKAEHIVAKRDLEAMTTELGALRAKFTETEAKLADASKGDVVALRAQLAEVEKFVADYAAAALAALGKPSSELPAGLSERMKLVEAARAQLALSIVPGGVSQPAGRSDPKASAASTPDFSAFKRRA